MTNGTFEYRPAAGGVSSVRGADASIKPGVKRSEPQVQIVNKYFGVRGVADRGCDSNSQMNPLSAASRTQYFPTVCSWGFAALHPRLYAVGRFADSGLELANAFPVKRRDGNVAW